jgi:hypothetical protein
MDNTSRDRGLTTGDELMHVQAELWNHVFAYTRSMSLRCAIELGIPDAVNRLGGVASVPELVTALSCHGPRLMVQTRCGKGDGVRPR